MAPWIGLREGLSALSALPALPIVPVLAGGYALGKFTLLPLPTLF